jgi:putative glutathione S-transferase
MRSSSEASISLFSLHATKDDDNTATPSSSTSPSTSLYQPVPNNKPWTFGILTTGFPPQQILVPVVKFITFQVWRLMMNELVTHDEQGRFIRESYQAVEDNESTTSLVLLQPASSDEDGPRYRLYLGNPCPWCHRVKSAVSLLQITDIPITMLIDDAEKASKGGWILPKSDDISNGIAKELITGDLAGVYNYLFRHVLKEGERYKGRCTAPLLVDTSLGKIVSNESNEIMILLNEYARTMRDNSKGATGIDLRPLGMEEMLDVATKRWYNLLWNGAYRCGFATSQVAYDEAAKDVLLGLTEMNTHLATSPYLVGESITEVDIKNFAWLTRHDYAYTVIFKSPGGRIAQYPHIASYVKRMVTEHPVLLDSTDMADACGSYYRQLFMLNFGRIIPYIPSVREWVAEL